MSKSVEKNIAFLRNAFKDESLFKEAKKRIRKLMRSVDAGRVGHVQLLELYYGLRDISGEWELRKGWPAREFSPRQERLLTLVRNLENQAGFAWIWGTC